MKRIWFAVTVAAASLILGTGSMAVGKELPPSPDELLARQIWMRLRTAPHLEKDRITVDVDDGIAVLEGTVDSEAHKKEAQQLAHVDGILGVNNRLRVWVFD
jgi:osmotically-inducible protein OsmY